MGCLGGHDFVFYRLAHWLNVQGDFLLFHVSVTNYSEKINLYTFVLI